MPITSGSVKLGLLALTAGGVLAVAGCGGGQTTSTAAGGGGASRASAAVPAVKAPPGGVGTARNAALGATVLVDGKGMTLYSLSAERHGRFICTSGACLSLWHPLTSRSAAPPRGGVASLATIRRADGTRQVIYRGMPLYTFAQDTRPGDAKGNGFKDVGVWKAVTVGPAKARPAPAMSSSSSSHSSSQGGYGY
jgi:predicted lipoprotein with Yx(FWY)xxD motif